MFFNACGCQEFGRIFYVVFWLFSEPITEEEREKCRGEFLMHFDFATCKMAGAGGDVYSEAKHGHFLQQFLGNKKLSCEVPGIVEVSYEAHLYTVPALA